MVARIVYTLNTPVSLVLAFADSNRSAKLCLFERREGTTPKKSASRQKILLAAKLRIAKNAGHSRTTIPRSD
jgi:hypothetical protein